MTTLTLKELKQDIILLHCKKCGKTTKHHPTRPCTETRRVPHPTTNIVQPIVVHRKREEYACQQCKTTSRFKSLAGSQSCHYNNVYFAIKANREKQLEGTVTNILFKRSRCPKCGRTKHYRSKLCKKCSISENFFAWRMKPREVAVEA
jgi:uncharacterized OB-fold protein